MNTLTKQKQLRNHKWLATGIFLFMALGFIVATHYQKNNPNEWIGYIKAFTEAAMVGALADWFAVTALFHHPFGIKIPHTNLIENSKEKIGDKLGQFVVENFLSPKNIRPYIEKISISTWLSQWLSSANNREKIIFEGSKILGEIVASLEDKAVEKFIQSKVEELTREFQLNHLLSQGLEHLIQQNEHQKPITYLSSEIRKYIEHNQNLIRERVSQQSFAFVPKFLDDKIANKIALGLMDYFEEVEKSEQHPLRIEISQQLQHLAQSIKEEAWKNRIDDWKNIVLQSDNVRLYTQNIWKSIKNSLQKELEAENSSLKLYVDKQLYLLSQNLGKNIELQEKTDRVIRSVTYRYFLRNSTKFGHLISETVGNWKGKELSEKLELEVGKDLQFIRINGTLVGGLVGLILYAISQLLS